MNLLKYGIFQFVEFVFFIVIFINLSSYLISFFIILKRKHTRTLLQTIKEGWSKNYLTQNIVSLSLLISSISIFWFLILISSNFKPYSIQDAFKNNSFIALYILISCYILIFYSIFISMNNVKRTKELTPVLGYLSLWHSVDNLTDAMGWSPITDISLYFRKNLINSEFAGVVVSSIIWLIIEYVYKILIVAALLYLMKDNFFH